LRTFSDLQFLYKETHLSLPLPAAPKHYEARQIGTQALHFLSHAESLVSFTHSMHYQEYYQNLFSFGKVGFTYTYFMHPQSMFFP